jgi:hypothetical protein
MRRPFALLIALTLGTLTTGCASKKVLTEQELGHLRAAPVLHVVRGEPSSLSVTTDNMKAASMVGGLLFGAIGGGIAAAITSGMAQSDGKKMAKEYQLDDPVVVVTDRVVAGLTERQLAPSSISSVAEAVKDVDADALAKVLPGATVLAFRTDSWGLNASGSGYYRLEYSASARLVRTTDAAELWKIRCEVDDKQIPKMSMAQITVNSAESLKARLQEAAQLCADKLVQQMMGGTISASVKSP